MTVERTLHHFPLDPASRQVRLVLGEKRLPFADVQVRYWERPRELTRLNPSGMMPTTMCAAPSRSIVRFTSAGSPPKRLIHKSWLITTTRGPPSWSSSAVNVRPRAASTPNSGNSVADTRAPYRCCRRRL